MTSNNSNDNVKNDLRQRDISGLYLDPVVSIMRFSFVTKVQALAVSNPKRALIYKHIGNELIEGYLRGETDIAVVRHQPFHCVQQQTILGSYYSSSYFENLNVFINKGFFHRFHSGGSEGVALLSLPELNAYYMGQGEAVYRNYLADLAQGADITESTQKGATRELRANPPKVYCEWVGK